MFRARYVAIIARENTTGSTLAMDVPVSSNDPSAEADSMYANPNRRHRAPLTKLIGISVERAA